MPQRLCHPPGRDTAPLARLAGSVHRVICRRLTGPRLDPHPVFPSRESARREAEDPAPARQAAEMQRDSWRSAVTAHSQDTHSRHRRTNPALPTAGHRPGHQNRAKPGTWQGLPAPMATAGSSSRTRWVMAPTSRDSPRAQPGTSPPGTRGEMFLEDDSVLKRFV